MSCTRRRRHSIRRNPAPYMSEAMSRLSPAKFAITAFTSSRVIGELLKEYSSRGLVAPTVCTEVPPALEQNSYAGLLKQCGIGQIVLIDKDRVFAKRFGIVEFPTTFLIDRNHVVWQAITGIHPLMTEDFRNLVKSLVTE